MKKLIIILLTLLSISYCILWISRRSSNPFRDKQLELAKYLGVDIHQYEPVEYFPITYFNDILKPGMSLRQVHDIIKGYDLVFMCGNYSEIYYYFSKSDKDSLRFQVFYDRYLKYEDFQTEDDNSRYLIVDTCYRNSLIDDREIPE